MARTRFWNTQTHTHNGQVRHYMPFRHCMAGHKNPMTLVGFEPGPPGYKSNALPLSQRVYSLRQLSEIGYKPISYA